MASSACPTRVCSSRSRASPTLPRASRPKSSSTSRTLWLMSMLTLQLLPSNGRHGPAQHPAGDVAPAGCSLARGDLVCRVCASSTDRCRSLVSTGTLAASSSQRHHSIRAPIVNGLFFGLSAVVAFAALRARSQSCRVDPAAIFVVGLVQLQRGIDQLEPVRRAIEAAAATWHPGDAFRFAPTMLASSEAGLVPLDRYARLTSIGLGILAVVVGLILLAFVPSAVGQILHCRRQLDIARSELRGSASTLVSTAEDAQVRRY